MANCDIPYFFYVDKKYIKLILFSSMCVHMCAFFFVGKNYIF